jgi:hypothetical protein
MLSHAGTRAFLDVYLGYLRVLGNIVNVDVVNVSVEHEFTDGLLDNGSSPGTEKKESESSGVNKAMLKGPDSAEKEMVLVGKLARTIWEGVEGGGVATVGWPTKKYVMTAAARGASLQLTVCSGSWSWLMRYFYFCVKPRIRSFNSFRGGPMRGIVAGSNAV